MHKLQNFLQELKQYGIEKKIPNISPEVGTFINQTIKEAKSKTGLEIGCANGYSTIWIAEALQQNNGKLISIDFSAPSLTQAKENLKKAKLDDIVKFKFGDALQIIPQLNQKFDFIFLDAQKGHYHLFWDLIKTKIHSDSIIIVDDIIKFPKKTAEFSKQIAQEKKFTYKILPLDEDDGIMVIRKNQKINIL